MRALISVFDKTGLLPFAKGLADLGVEIVSSGGTAKTLRDNGIPCLEVEEVTGAPEMLEGRVKTLHPHIHGGILADRSKPEHMQAIADRGIAPIDLVVCNLYAFHDNPSIELIDIGGPSMVRAAAKNHDAVGIVVDPSDYESVLSELQDDTALSAGLRKKLAAKAFAHTAAYDAEIAAWFANEPSAEEANEPFGLPKTLSLRLERAEILRYGENPHQQGARYRVAGQTGWWDSLTQHSGMALSFLNLFDADAAWNLVHKISDGPAATIIKHANPCGAAIGHDLATAYSKAFACDPISAFGGIVALNRNVDLALAEQIVANPKPDVLIAPSYDPEALALLAAKRKNARILSAEPPGERGLELRRIDGGFLAQLADPVSTDRSEWKVVTKIQPDAAQWDDIVLAWVVCAMTSSNAIVIAKDGQAPGIGAGQQNRLESSAIAAKKAGEKAKGGVAASDAFFPFRDGLDAIAESGVTTIIQPGGSMRDEEVISAADEHGLAMIFTGERHFRH